MKKSLILLPIAAMLISGCSLLPSKKGKSSSSSNTQQSGGGSQGTSLVPVTPGGGGGGGVTPAEGASHALPWELKASDLYDSTKNGYAQYEGTYDFDGTKVTFQAGVMVNPDMANLHGDNYPVIQLRKSGGPAGILTISKVKPTSVEVKALVKSTYSWGSNQIGTVKFNGSAVTVPSESTSETSTYSSDYKVHTVSLAVNASADGDFVIENTGAFAFYIISLKFVA